MTDKEKAISITESFLQAHKYYKNYVVDLADIQERVSLWYIPFKEAHPNTEEILEGAYNGLIVDKASYDYFQPGSALELEEWMYGFTIGLRGGQYDLLIEKVNDYPASLDMLLKLGLSYVKIEMEGGTEWKIPKSFNRKEIKRRLDRLPCVFKNQAFTFSIKEFRVIRNSGIFTYKLLKSTNTDPNLLGELISE